MYALKANLLSFKGGWGVEKQGSQVNERKFGPFITRPYTEHGPKPVMEEEVPLMTGYWRDNKK